MSEDKDIGWMYQGAKALVNREDYLLGKKIDKNFEKYSDAVNEQKPDAFDALLHTRTVVRAEPSAIIKPKTSALETYVVATEDPLVAVKVKEETRRREVMENPLMKLKFQKMLKEMMAEKMNKTEKKKKKKKKRKKDSDHDKKPKKKKKSQDSAERSSISETTSKRKASHQKRNSSASESEADSDSGSHHFPARSRKHSDAGKSKDSSLSPTNTKKKSSRHRSPKSPSRNSSKRRRSRSASETAKRRRRSSSSSAERNVAKNVKGKGSIEQVRRSRENIKRRSRYRDESVSSRDHSRSKRDSKSPKGRKGQERSRRSRGSLSPVHSRRTPPRPQKRRENSSSPSPGRTKGRNSSKTRCSLSPIARRRERTNRSRSRSASPKHSKRESRSRSASRKKKNSPSPSPSTSNPCNLKDERKTASVLHKKEKRISGDSPNSSPDSAIANTATAARSEHGEHAEFCRLEKKGTKQDRTFDTHIPEHLRPKGSGTDSGEEDVEDRYDREEKERKKRFEGFGLVGIKKKSDEAASSVQNPYELSRKPVVPVYKKPERRRPLTEEEKQEKLREMAQNAAWRQETRKSNLKRARLVEEIEAVEETNDKAPSFIRSQLNSAASDLTVEQRLQSNKKSLQRSYGFMDQKFTSK